MNVTTLSSLKKPIFYHNLTIVFENERKLWQNIPLLDNCVSLRWFFTFKKMELWPIQSCLLQKPFQKQISKSFCKSTKQAGDWSQHSIWSAHNNVACLTSDLISPLMMYRTQEVYQRTVNRTFQWRFHFWQQRRRDGSWYWGPTHVAARSIGSDFLLLEHLAPGWLSIDG